MTGGKGMDTDLQGEISFSRGEKHRTTIAPLLQLSSSFHQLNIGENETGAEEVTGQKGGVKEMKRRMRRERGEEQRGF